jgi:hypothetical protein
MVFCLQDIIKPPKNPPYKYQRQGVYRKNDYIKDLRKNYTELGLDLKIVDKIEKEIPDVHYTHTLHSAEKLNNKFSDDIIVTLQVVGGEIKINVNTLFNELYEDYFSKGIVPPVDKQVEAYRSVGASDAFIKKFNHNTKQKKLMESKIDAIISKVFEKEPKKKIPKKKEKIEEVEDIEEDIEEEEEEEENTEEEALVDEDDIDEDEDVEEDIEIDVEE